ncbi:MAG: PepSY domain-containing protein [Flavobacteriales bacterium]|nr:PepSY domain-containing protein [Flavobacteriales bacterium]
MHKLSKSLIRKRRKDETYFKYVLSLFHLWIGLTSSVILVIICLTGCLYVFKNEIENCLYHVDIENTSGEINVELSFEKFTTKYGAPTFLIVPSDSNHPIEISSQSKQSIGEYVYFHPNSGEIVMIRNKSITKTFQIILEIHRWLLVEKPGKTIIGITVLLFVFMLFSGIIMWFPKRVKNIKQGLVIKTKANFRRINYDLHKVLGFYSFILLLIISITGLYVSFHWFKNTIIVSLGGPSIVLEEDQLGQSEMSKTLSSSFESIYSNLMNKSNQKTKVKLGKTLNSIKLLYNFKGKTRVQFPIEGTGYYSIKRFGNSLFTQSLYDEIRVNSQGEVKELILFKNQPLYKQFMLIAKPLHTGEIFGTLTTILYFIVCFIAFSLPITGIIIWQKRAF